jgi:uncharacterized membrane protein
MNWTQEIRAEHDSSTATEEIMQTVRFAAICGATLGTGIAVVLLFLVEIKQDPALGMVTFSLCPVFALGFLIKSKILFYIVMIVGNGISYGILGAIIGLVFALFQRLTARNRNE